MNSYIIQVHIPCGPIVTLREQLTWRMFVVETDRGGFGDEREEYYTYPVAFEAFHETVMACRQELRDNSPASCSGGRDWAVMGRP
jgi:hypothetical protein